MSDPVAGGEAGAEGAVESTDPVWLGNALRFERAKNQVLLDEVIALEDEIVNRCMADFDAVVSDASREFWREQLLANRESATVALEELARAKQALGGAPAAGAPPTRRPLHNRALARPVVPGVAAAGTVAPGEADDRAARIRNRAHEISKSERIPFSAAFRRAEGELNGK